MDLSTNTAAATPTAVYLNGDGPYRNLTFKVKSASSADLRIITGYPITINGVATADTTGILLEAANSDSISLPCETTYLCKTETDGVAADFFVLATK